MIAGVPLMLEWPADSLDSLYMARNIFISSENLLDNASFKLSL